MMLFLSLQAVLRQSFNFQMARGTDPDSLALIDAAFSGTSTGGSEIFYRRKDGSELWSAILISPVQHERGDVAQHFFSFVDLSQSRGRPEKCLRSPRDRRSGCCNAKMPPKAAENKPGVSSPSAGN
jgi:hypothetical protein